MTSRSLISLICIIVAFSPPCRMHVSAASQDQTPSRGDARLEWFLQGRFGLFIHWGPVSLKGTEIGWSRDNQVPVKEYDNLHKQFNPTGFNAAEWVTIAKQAGMKIVRFVHWELAKE